MRILHSQVQPKEIKCLFISIRFTFVKLQPSDAYYSHDVPDSIHVVNINNTLIVCSSFKNYKENKNRRQIEKYRTEVSNLDDRP